MARKIIAAIGVLLVVVASAAYVYVAHLKMWGLTLNREVKPIEVATLAFTVVIAILLQFYVVFSADNERVEKDLLILNARDALAKLRDCRDTFVECFEAKTIRSQDQTRIQTQLRSLNHALDALDICLGKSRCSSLCVVCKSLVQQAIKYKTILTGGIFPSQPYPPQVYTDHQTAYREMDEELQGLIFSINKA